MSMIFNKASKIQVLSFMLFPLISQTIFCQLLNNLPFMYIFDLFLLKALVQLDNDIVVNVKICNYFMLYLKVLFSIGGSVKRKCFLLLSFLLPLSPFLSLSLRFSLSLFLSNTYLPFSYYSPFSLSLLLPLFLSHTYLLFSLSFFLILISFFLSFFLIPLSLFFLAPPPLSLEIQSYHKMRKISSVC